MNSRGNKLGLTMDQILSSKTFFVILILLLRLSLDISYVYLVAPYFSWSETRYILAPNYFKLLESYFLTFVLALTIPFKVKKPSDFLIGLLFIVPVLSTFSLYGLMDMDQGYTYMVAIAFLIIILMRKAMPRIKIANQKRGYIFALSLSIVGTIVTLVWFISQGGFQYFNLNFLNISRIHEFREAVKNSIFEGNLLLNYLAFWTYYAFMSALILWALYYKRYALFFMLVGVQVIFFGLSSRRGVLVGLVLVLGSYMFIKRRNSLTLLTSALIAGVLGSIILALLFHKFLPANLLIERSIFTPARANYAYYEFFSKAGFVYLSSTKLSLIDYPFPNIPEHMVGSHIFHTDSVSCGGFLATSYMHFGFAGMIMFAFIVGLLLRLLDSLIVKRMPLRYGLPLVVTPVYMLFTSADFTDSLTTYGILPSMLLLWLFGSQREFSKKFNGSK